MNYLTNEYCVLKTNRSNHNCDKTSMKSSISTNSTFSAGFLPSPDMFNQSACSSYVGFKDQRQAPHKSIDQMNGIVALAAASINSSLLQFKRADTPTSGLKQKMTNSLLNVSNLKPVKITVQSEAGSVKSYDDLSKSRQQLSEELYKSSSKTSSEPTVGKSTENIEDVGAANAEKKAAKIPSSNQVVNSAPKPGTEVLTLISTWIKNAPNDFLDTRVIDEIKTFFNQLDSLKSSFKPWTTKLKQALNLEVKVFIFSRPANEMN